MIILAFIDIYHPNYENTHNEGLLEVYALSGSILPAWQGGGAGRAEISSNSPTRFLTRH